MPKAGLGRRWRQEDPVHLVQLLPRHRFPAGEMVDAGELHMGPWMARPLQRWSSHVLVIATSAWVRPCPAGRARWSTLAPARLRRAARREALSAGTMGSIAPDKMRT